MRREEDYMDQLFKDHFADFEKTAPAHVWEGVVEKGTMANGKRFSFRGWRGAFALLLGLSSGLALLSGSSSSVPLVSDSLNEQVLIERVPTMLMNAQDGLPQASTKIQVLEEVVKKASSVASEKGTKAQEPGTVPGSGRTSLLATNSESGVYDSYNARLNHIADGSSYALNEIQPLQPQLAVADHEEENTLTEADRKALRNGWEGTTYYKKERGGHWFVTGGMVLDGHISEPKTISFSDGLVFGAGKYLTKNSFFDISLRGTWDMGFNMRATYTQLFTKGKLQPFVQAGLAWDDDLDMRAALGLMYNPGITSDWRFFMSVGYERASRLFDSQANEAGVFEMGVQLRLRGTEHVLSNNNWMNSIPHYKLPRGWYVESSSNFAFFDKTKVTRISAYMGKNISRRLFARGGVRLGRDRVVLPAHLQYHVLVRKRLRFGAYGGPSLNITQPRLGAELGFIAYYEIMPNWSLFVAPVIFDNSDYQERIFETGVRLYLPGKK